VFLRVNSILPVGQKYKVVSLFGYRTNGVPGIEIKGLPNNQNIVREKLVYLSKMFGVKVPVRRFHLCIDLPKEILRMKKDAIEDRFFDLPLLLLYWSLAEVVKIQELEYVFSLGKISTDGRIIIPEISETYLKSLDGVIREKACRSITMITSTKQSYPDVRCITISSLLNSISDTEIKSKAL
jgi:hypothetical protein